MEIHCIWYFMQGEKRTSKINLFRGKQGVLFLKLNRSGVENCFQNFKNNSELLKFCKLPA